MTLHNLYKQGESKISVIRGVWCKIVLFCYVISAIFFVFFFDTSVAQNKPRNFFLSQNLKFRKTKM